MRRLVGWAADLACWTAQQEEEEEEEWRLGVLMWLGLQGVWACLAQQLVCSSAWRSHSDLGRYWAYWCCCDYLHCWVEGLMGSGHFSQAR